jgi:hypothetical protein
MTTSCNGNKTNYYVAINITFKVVKMLLIIKKKKFDKSFQKLEGIKIKSAINYTIQDICWFKKQENSFLFLHAFC